MKAVLLAGGLGTRLREETEIRPKPMVEVGGKPILWHIMKNLSSQGIKDFVVLTGYKATMIKEYFLNYEVLSNDLTLTLGDRSSLQIHGVHDEKDWTVTVAFTGEDTNTGGRVLEASQYFANDHFFLTYGDGLADVNLTELIAAHSQSKALATITTVQPMSRFGVLDIDSKGSVSEFREKPRLDGWINIGFMIMEPGAMDYFTDNCILEEGPLASLAKAGQLSAFRHEGFWQPMDTYRESKLLNDLWASGNAPWKIW